MVFGSHCHRWPLFFSLAYNTRDNTFYELSGEVYTNRPYILMQEYPIIENATLQEFSPFYFAILYIQTKSNSFMEIFASYCALLDNILVKRN